MLMKNSSIKSKESTIRMSGLMFNSPRTVAIDAINAQNKYIFGISDIINQYNFILIGISIFRVHLRVLEYYIPALLSETSKVACEFVCDVVCSVPRISTDIFEI